MRSGERFGHQALLAGQRPGPLCDMPCTGHTRLGANELLDVCFAPRRTTRRAADPRRDKALPSGLYAGWKLEVVAGAQTAARGRGRGERTRVGGDARTGLAHGVLDVPV